MNNKTREHYGLTLLSAGTIVALFTAQVELPGVLNEYLLFLSLTFWGAGVYLRFGPLLHALFVYRRSPRDRTRDEALGPRETTSFTLRGHRPRVFIKIVILWVMLLFVWSAASGKIASTVVPEEYSGVAALLGVLPVLVLAQTMILGITLTLRMLRSKPVKRKSPPPEDESGPDPGLY